jgi:hypothetical protein
MKSLVLFTFFLSFIFCTASCSFFKKNQDEDEAKPAPLPMKKLVGRIASIPPGQKFVLIQSYGKWERKAGEILTTQGEDKRAANLLATGEALGQYAAADIQSGQVEVGDAVFSQPPAPTPPASEPATPSPASPDPKTAPAPVSDDPSESPLIPTDDPE